MVQINGSFAFARGGGLRVGAKANVPFIFVIENFKIFAYGQSPDRKNLVFLSRLSCQGCRIISYHYALNSHNVNGLPITARQ
jgi:hypothetical protein